ncbi:hypothetical protein D0T57_01645 [Dysgonomonas sp. 511]|nr:hypothetical protein [Dysgonomonas sp. 511]
MSICYKKIGLYAVLLNAVFILDILVDSYVSFLQIILAISDGITRNRAIKKTYIFDRRVANTPVKKLFMYICILCFSPTNITI